MEDASTAADHRLSSPQAPGKAEARIEVVHVTARRAQITEYPIEIGRTVEIVIEQVVFIGPCQRVADRQILPHSPLVSRKQAIPVIARSLRLPEILRLSAIANAEQHRKDREFLKIGDRRQQTGTKWACASGV